MKGFNFAESGCTNNFCAIERCRDTASLDRRNFCKKKKILLLLCILNLISFDKIFFGLLNFGYCSQT